MRGLPLLVALASWPALAGSVRLSWTVDGAEGCSASVEYGPTTAYGSSVPAQRSGGSFFADVTAAGTLHYRTITCGHASEDSVISADTPACTQGWTVQTDLYGGAIMRCPFGHATGYWHFEKLTYGGATRWWLINPLGNPTFLRGVYLAANHYDISGAVYASKYASSQSRFYTARNERLKAWGFNALGEWTSSGFPWYATGTSYASPRLPASTRIQANWIGVGVQFDRSDCRAPEPVKNVYENSPTARPMPDAYDPRYGRCIANAANSWRSTFLTGPDYSDAGRWAQSLYSFTANAATDSFTISGALPASIQDEGFVVYGGASLPDGLKDGDIVYALGTGATTGVSKSPRTSAGRGAQFRWNISGSGLLAPLPRCANAWYADGCAAPWMVLVSSDEVDYLLGMGKRGDAGPSKRCDNCGDRHGNPALSIVFAQPEYWGWRSTDGGGNTKTWPFSATSGLPDITVTGNTYSNGNQVRLWGGSLPTPLAKGVTYYVCSRTADSIRLATNSGCTAIQTPAADGSGTVYLYTGALRRCTSGQTGCVEYTDKNLAAKSAWRDWVAAKYGTVGALNAAWGSTYTSFDSDGGYGVGTGLMDENGSLGHAWFGNPSDPERGYSFAGVAAAVAADVRAWSQNYGKQYATVWNSAIRRYAPHAVLVGPNPLCGGALCAWPEIARGMAEVFDGLTVGFDTAGDGYHKLTNGIATYDDGVTPRGYWGVDEHTAMYNALGSFKKPFILYWIGSSQTDSSLYCFHAVPTNCTAGNCLGTGDGGLKTFSKSNIIAGDDPACYMSAYISSVDYPWEPGSVAVTAGAVSGTDDGNGKLIGAGIASGTVDCATGSVSVTFTDAPAAGTLVHVRALATARAAAQTKNFASQASRGAGYARDLSTFLGAAGSDGTRYVAGVQVWQYEDKISEAGGSWGLISYFDNAYDGVESVTGSVLCQWTPAYACGGDVRASGDFIGPVRAANLGVYWSLLGLP